MAWVQSYTGYSAHKIKRRKWTTKEKKNQKLNGTFTFDKTNRKFAHFKRSCKAVELNNKWNMNYERKKMLEC